MSLKCPECRRQYQSLKEINLKMSSCIVNTKPVKDIIGKGILPMFVPKYNCVYVY